MTPNRRRCIPILLALVAPAALGQEMTLLHFDDFEVDLGWTSGAPGDDATLGLWNRVDPEATIAQPEDDHTADPGTHCWVTDGRAGTGDGTYDVDGGATTLISPEFDLTAWAEVRIGYYRWFSNAAAANPHDDAFFVDISDDGGATWHNVETVGPTGPETLGGWFYHEFSPADILGSNGVVTLRFVAEDRHLITLVEAAVDDFQIEVGALVGDLDADGDIDLLDCARFSQCHGQDPQLAECTASDVNRDQSIDLADWARLGEILTGPS